MEQMLPKPLSQRVQSAERLVYLVTTDQLFGVFLSEQISHFGYNIQVLKDVSSLDNALAEHLSVAVLVDISSLAPNPHDQHIFNDLSRIRQTNIPFIFVSDIDDQSLRLKAIRAGGSAFLAKPVDIVSLIDKLDLLGMPVNADPYRVLIVEDQQTIANYYKMVLKMSGMDAEAVSNSSQVLQFISEYHPDLILLDLYMPEINGIELVRLIRQIDDFVSIPIVFVSSEEDFAKQMDAMSLGGDDFLIKPIRAAHLVALVRNRLERLKTLRSFMMRDSLTGLLNHTSFRGTLNLEISRCKRQKSSMALAMLDIDHFKLINDTYGHAAGDSILKSISRLLKQRLRKSDILGRYGGEEFVALLLDASEEQAYTIIDELRQHFAQIEQFPERGKGIYVTFSGGIATFPQYSSANMLSEAADQAMYAAKAAGRNRILIAHREADP